MATPLTLPPPAPLRGEDGATFDAKAELFVPWFSTNVAEQNALIAEFNAWTQNGVPSVLATARGMTATAGFNNRPALQAIIDLLSAMGGGVILVPPGDYDFHAPVRTSNADDTNPAFWNPDGNTLVIANNARICIRGTGPTRPRFRFYGVGGASFNGTTSGTNYQVVGGYVWRGNGFYLRSSVTNPGDNARSALWLDNIDTDGGAPINRTYLAYPARTSDGLGWDVTHKCIMAEPNLYGGDILVTNCHFKNWRGENIYANNDTSSRLVTRNLEVSDSNGQGINPNGCKTDVEFIARNCFYGIEGFTGEAGSRIKATMIDCYGVHGGNGVGSPSGGAGTLQPGGPSFDGVRVTAGILPVLDLDLTLIHCSPLNLGGWIRGRVLAVDTAVIIGGAPFTGDVTGSDLSITCVTDQIDGMCYPLLAGLATAGGMKTRSNVIRVSHIRTADAMTANRKATHPLGFSGSLGTGNNVWISGQSECLRPPAAVAAVPDKTPIFWGDIGPTTDGGGSSQNVITTPSVNLDTPVWYLTGSGTAAITCNAAMLAKMQFGQEVTIYSAGPTLTLATSGAGFYLGAALTIAPFTFAKFKYNGGGFAHFSGGY